MRIPEQIIDDVRRATDIVEVVGGTVKLRRRGKNFIGLCPFHQEKTPSFNVNPEMQIYKCFGCGKGGNVFHFLMETERLSFVETVRMLAEKAGVVIPEGERDEARVSELERLHQVLAFAGKTFYANLTKTEEGKSALAYFSGRRFSDETIRSFGLGYAMNSWDHLLKKLGAGGFTPDEAARAGLLRTRDDGTWYDLFRGRVMFPILLPNGRVAGFGARKIRDDDPIQGKYINSPDSEVYNKSRILFGLSHAKTAIRQEDSTILVEGYADMISLFQEGIQHTVASAGTALTDEQLRLLSRYSRNLVLVFDGDSAGAKAAVRGIDTALEQDFEVRVVELPGGDDPDSFVHAKGAAAFRELVEQARSFIDFKASLFHRSGLMNDPAGKTRAVRSIVASIARIRDEIKQAFYIKDVAERYGLYEGMLLRELEQRNAGRQRSADARSAPARPPEAPAPTDTPPLPPVERDLVRILLRGDMQAIDTLLTSLNENDISDDRARRIVHAVLGLIDRTGRVSVASLLDTVSDADLVPIIMDLSIGRYELSKGWEDGERTIESEDPVKAARDVVAAVRLRALRKAIDDNQREMLEARARGDDLGPYLVVHQELTASLHELERTARSPVRSQESDEHR